MYDLIRTLEAQTSLTFGDARRIAATVRHDAAPLPAAVHHVNRSGGNPNPGRWVSPFARVRAAFTEVAA